MKINKLALLHKIDVIENSFIFIQGLLLIIIGLSSDTNLWSRFALFTILLTTYVLLHLIEKWAMKIKVDPDFENGQKDPLYRRNGSFNYRPLIVPLLIIIGLSLSGIIYVFIKYGVDLLVSTGVLLLTIAIFSLIFDLFFKRVFK